MKRRFMAIPVALVLALAGFSGWIFFGSWTDPEPGPVFVSPDAIVILGGGDPARWQHGLAVAREHPAVPVVVTGDGGAIVEYLEEEGLPSRRILHEDAATSTVENAKYTAAVLSGIEAQRVILVTNFFHASRSRAIFGKYQPEREFCVSFPPKPDPMYPWDHEVVWRERTASVHNFIHHGVWSW